MLLCCPYRNMCYTVLLSSLVIVRVTAFAAAVEPAIRHTRGDNVSLINYNTPGESKVSEDEANEGTQVLSAVRALNDKLRGLDFIPHCKNGSGPYCFQSSNCPVTSARSSDTPVVATVPVGETCVTVHSEDTRADSIEGKLTYAEVWGYGFLSVGIISLSGVFGGILWPLINSKYYSHAMRVLIGLAFGTLASTSVFQLIPQSWGLEENDKKTIHVPLTILGSFWVLYMFETLSRIFLYHKPESEIGRRTTNEQVIAEKNGLLPGVNTADENHRPFQHLSQTSLHRIAANHTHAHSTEIAPVAWMITLGDGLHNFVDGMSIGAGFAKDFKTGLAISMAIACEEFPHELGDFAVLIRSGMSIKKALCFNFGSALTSVAGLVVSLLLNNVQAGTMIFAFSSGLFLYVSLSSLMFELRSMVTESLETSDKTAALFILFEQNCGLIVGFCILYTITSFPINLG